MDSGCEFGFMIARFGDSRGLEFRRFWLRGVGVRLYGFFVGCLDATLNQSPNDIESTTKGFMIQGSAMFIGTRQEP